MKAMILERRGEEAALLCEDGTFVRRRVSGEVGETVELAAETVLFPMKRRSRWLRGAVAAVLALTVTGGTLGYMGGTASAYVSLEVEDSAIELTVNHFGRVISVDAVSEDAEELAQNLSREVKHRTVEDALDHTMNRLRDEGILKDETDGVIAGVASDNGARKAKLAETVEQAAAGHPLVVTESSRAEREQAREQHISIGKFGMTRDHRELPKAGDWNEAAGQTELSDETEPAVPAEGEAELEAEPQQDREPQRGEERQEHAGRAPGERPAELLQGGEQQREQAETREQTPPQENREPPEQTLPQENQGAPEQTPPQENREPPEQTPPQENREPQEQTPQQENREPPEQEPPQENRELAEHTPPQENQQPQEQVPQEQPQQPENPGQQENSGREVPDGGIGPQGRDAMAFGEPRGAGRPGMSAPPQAPGGMGERGPA